MKQAEQRNASATSKSGSDVVRIAITSGKGGVGKSNFALNTSIALAGFGKKVLLIDADTNLANLDILVGINPKYNLSDVFTGAKTIEEIIVHAADGIDILPGSSGMIEMLELEHQVQNRLVQSYTNLEKQYDYIILDTGAGLTKDILAYTTSSDEVIIITNREPTAITDAYAMIKVITHTSPTVRLHVLVNMVKSPQDAAEVFDKLNLVVQNFLSVPISYLGYIPVDPNVSTAVSHQMAFASAFPKCAASVAVRMTARKIMQADRKGALNKSKSFLSRLIKPGKDR
jgi:flagellar biosynthesis protein FlhG